MKKIILLTAILTLACLRLAYSDGAENAPSKTKPEQTPASDSPLSDSFSRERTFSYETDEDSARDSLNRVSGHIDLGFTTSDQVYKSNNHNDPTQILDREKNPRGSVLK